MIKFTCALEGFTESIMFNPFPNKLLFLRLLYKSFENAMGKGEIVLNEQFLLFMPQHR